LLVPTARTSMLRSCASIICPSLHYPRHISSDH
jgi:hypothetical protein